MYKLRSLLLISLIFPTTSACVPMFGVQSTTVKTIRLDGPDQNLNNLALIMPGDKRAIIIRKGPTGNAAVCAEPTPDISLSTLSDAAADLAASANSVNKIANPELTADISSKLTTTAAELSGRNSTVLIARDFLYRLCELSTNYPPSSDDYKKAAAEYSLILSAIADLASAAKSDAAAKEKAATTALIKAKVDAGIYVRELQEKIDDIIAYVTKSGHWDEGKLKKLVEKIPDNEINEKGRKTILEQSSTNALREFLNEIGDPIVTSMWRATKS